MYSSGLVVAWRCYCRMGSDVPYNLDHALLKQLDQSGNRAMRSGQRMRPEYRSMDEALAPTGRANEIGNENDHGGDSRAARVAQRAVSACVGKWRAAPLLDCDMMVHFGERGRWGRVDADVHTGTCGCPLASV